jgi:hypothetical protein
LLDQGTVLLLDDFDGGDDAYGDLVTGRSGDVSVEDGDVLGVDAQQVQGGVAVTCDVCRDHFQT